MTSGWYVDNLKISHTSEVVTESIKTAQYGNMGRKPLSCPPWQTTENMHDISLRILLQLC